MATTKDNTAAAAAKETIAAVAPKPELKAVNNTKLMPSRLKAQGFMNAHHECEVEHGTSPEDVLNPAFWSLVATLIAPFDTIKVRAADGSYWLELLVIGKTDFEVKVRPLRFVPLTSDEHALPDSNEKYEVKFLGSNKWCVIRKSDRVTVFKGGQNKDAALAEMAKF